MLKRNRDIKIHEANGLELTFAAQGALLCLSEKLKSQCRQAAGSFPHRAGRKQVDLVRRGTRKSQGGNSVVSLPFVSAPLTLTSVCSGLPSA